MPFDPQFFTDDLTLSRQWRLAFIAWGAISLLAMLAYPFAYDQAAFFVGGEMVVKNGAIPYRDLIDTKPPLIFYLYGLSSFLFGHNQWGIRLFDVLWQAVTALMLYRLIRKHAGSEPIAFLSTFVYVWQYATTGYWMTAQAESFAILPMLSIAKWTLEFDSRRAVRCGIYTGIALGIVLLFKFTLVLFFFGVIGWLLRHRRSGWISYLISSGVIFLLTVGAYLFHLHLTNALPNFIEGIKWVREYAAITPLFGVETIGMEYQKLFPEFLLRTFSIALTALGITGLIHLSGSRTEKSRFYLLFSLCFAFALLGVLYERKFFPYHYTRAFVFFSPFVAVGAVAVSRWLRSRSFSRVTLIVIGIVALFFSPVMQTWTQTIGWSKAALLGQDREALVQAKVPNYYAIEQRQIGEYLQRSMTPEEDLFFWGNGVGVYYTNRTPVTFALTNTPFVTSWTSPQWKQTLLLQLVREQPEYFVVEWGDNRDYISGTKFDSYQLLKQWTELKSFLFTHYQEVTRIGHFIVYRRS